MKTTIISGKLNHPPHIYAMLIGALIGFITELSGCSDNADKQAATSENVAVRVIDVKTSNPITTSYDIVREYCYKGIVYVKFNEGTASWESIMYDKETLAPKTCNVVTAAN